MCNLRATKNLISIKNFNQIIFNRSFFNRKQVFSTELNKKILLKSKITNNIYLTALNTKLHGFSNESNNEKNNFNRNLSKILVFFIGVLGVGWYQIKSNQIYGKEKDSKENDTIECGEFVEGLPIYTSEDVKKHGKDSDRIWSTYKNGVYDITDFIESHPGGNKIILGAGTSLEPFWNMYAVHNQPFVYELLESYRIGNLKIDDQKKVINTNDPYKNDPPRHPLLKVLTLKPFNAESPKELSAENLITPNELFFVRNHLPVPIVDVKEFRLNIVDDLNGRTFLFTLDELKNKFKTHTIPVTIQCSGNKRKLMHQVEPVQGLMWDINAISTAEWTGVKLADVLDYCKIGKEDEGIKHVHFEGLDKEHTGACYGSSIPKEKAFDINGDVLLAFKMNGVDIPLDHGYPLRVIVPGVTGARSVKWLNKIILSNEESKSFWQQSDYKVLPPNIKNLKEADYSKFKAIQETPVQSGICQPLNGSVVSRDEEKITIKGYAFSGGGKDIDNVIVSVDGGKSWNPAIINQFDRPLNKSWSWAIWTLELDIPKNKESLEIVCVATDSAHNTQPENCKSIWNARGLLNNSWHSINVKLE